MDSQKITKKTKEFIWSFATGAKNFWHRIIQKQEKKVFVPNLDKQLVYSLSRSRIPSLQQIKYVGKYLTAQEKKIINFCLVVIVFNIGILGISFYQKHLELTPKSGGSYLEGLIGTPKYINPLYSNLSDVDNDLAYLIFSSLYKRGNNGELVSDLATSLEVSPDNKEYVIGIRSGVQWHNGNKLTADDIVFTFNTIKDKNFKSPLRHTFLGVNIEKLSDDKIKFILPEPYAAFPELLTFGIMSGELWQNVSADAAFLTEANLGPVGSGPYKLKSVIKDKETGRVSVMNLVSNENYYSSRPYITDLSFHFYPNFEEVIAAFNSNTLDGISYLPRDQKKNLAARNAIDFHQLKLPQLTALFFNGEGNPALKDKRIRQALSMAINKSDIIDNVFEGEAENIDSPILASSFAYNSGLKKWIFNPSEAKKILDESGWKESVISEDDIKKSQDSLLSASEEAKEQAQAVIDMGAGGWRIKDGKYLKIRLTTVDRSDNEKVLMAIKKQWEAIGVKVEIELVGAQGIQGDIIKPRNFEALYYAQVVGNDPDSYSFWHSSQSGESGMNITDYNNKEVDKLLEDARATTTAARIVMYKRFQEIINEDLPAYYLFSNYYNYVQSKKIKNYKVERILLPKDRFSNITEWYLKMGRKIVW